MGHAQRSSRILGTAQKSRSGDALLFVKSSDQENSMSRQYKYRKNSFSPLEIGEDIPDDVTGYSEEDDDYWQPNNAPNYGYNATANYSIFQEEADQIRLGFLQNTSVKELTLTSFVPEKIKAIAEGLKNSKVMERVYIKQKEYNQTIQPAAVPYLREIFAIPTIKFQIIRTNDDSVLEVIRGDSANYITHLRVSTESIQLNDLLHELRNNKALEDIYIDRLDMDSACNNISIFGNFKFSLTKLRVRIRSDECDQFFKALKQCYMLKHVDLSNSSITGDNAQSLADLIRTNCTITSLDLSDCKIDEKAFSIICSGLIHNKGIEELFLFYNPFERLEVSPQFLVKKKLKRLNVPAFDENMAKIFHVERLYINGKNFDGLKTATIKRLSIERISEIRQMSYLFNSLKNNTNIKSLAMFQVDGDGTVMEFCKQLKLNKTLRSIDSGYMPFSEKAFKLFCEAIETNDTIESLTHEGDFVLENEENKLVHDGYTPLLDALKKNTSLTSVDFSRLYCKERELEDVLIANPYIVFVRVTERERKSRVTELNDRNNRNVARRMAGIKLNITTLARSHWAHVLPTELWQLILDLVDGAEEQSFDLFMKTMALYK